MRFKLVGVNTRTRTGPKSRLKTGLRDKLTGQVSEAYAGDEMPTRGSGRCDWLSKQQRQNDDGPVPGDENTQMECKGEAVSYKPIHPIHTAVRLSS